VLNSNPFLTFHLYILRTLVTVRKLIKNLLPGHLPEFIIAGAQKSATTSLHYWLGQHPELVGSRPKEVCFFDRDLNYEKGISWYKKNFINTRNPLGRYKYFESTPEYLYRDYVPERIHQLNPKMKIVILLRDPVQRAFSAWSMYQFFKTKTKLPQALHESYITGMDNNIEKEFYGGKEFPSFAEVIEADIQKFETGSVLREPSIVRRGIYADQVKRYFDIFGKDQVLVIGFKDLTQEKKIEKLNAILKFVGVSPSTWDFLVDEPRNSKKSMERIDDKSAQKLTQFYEPHNKRLFDLIGFKPNW
jgi:hypothetical protein